MQRNCIFPGRYAPLTYYDWLRGRPRNTLMARNAREICTSHIHLLLPRQLVMILAAGKVPTSVSKFLAGGCLIALNKNKKGCPPDIRPIAVGETIRRLTGKCMCALVKDKATEFFQPLQLGVACHAGAEKVAHALRGCIEEHWMDEDFVVLKVDMRNAFNIVSRQAVLDECATFFP